MGGGFPEKDPETESTQDRSQSWCYLISEGGFITSITFYSLIQWLNLAVPQGEGVIHRHEGQDAVSIGSLRGSQPQKNARVKSPVVMGESCCLLPNRKPGQWLPQWVFLYCAYKGLSIINAQTYLMSLSTEPWPPSANARGAATQGRERICFWYLPLEFGLHFPREKNYYK